MTDLSKRHCAPCNAETPPIQGAALEALEQQLHQRWQVVDQHHLTARVDFPDFATALDFTNRVGALAEAEGHHPELCLTWGWVKMRIWTHAIDGLSENDFILAGKIDALAAAGSGPLATEG